MRRRAELLRQIAEAEEAWLAAESEIERLSPATRLLAGIR
jgi:hypothetical protein